MGINKIRRGGEDMKKEVIVTTERELTKEERRSFSKDHTKKKKSIRLRDPNFPLVISIIALLISIGTIILEKTI